MKIASLQLNSQNDLSVNLSVAKTAVSTAKAQGADLAVLPENACLMGRQADIADRFNELCEFFQTLAKGNAIHLIAGTLPCPFDKNGQQLNNDKFFQTSLAINDQGELIARYDKIHLFRATVADGVGSYDEGKTFCAGDTPTIANFMINNDIIKVGMMICFDLRFPYLAQKYHELGADILVAPSAFTYATGQANWQMLLQARALDSQCLVVGSAQGGMHKTANSERQTWGHSMIVQADGAILATSGSTDVDENRFKIIIAEFNKSKQHKIRANLPIFECMREF